MNIYDFEVKSIDRKKVSLEDYKGKVLLIVNTASKCGFTPQYEDLQKLYNKYCDKGFEILAFPCNQFKNQEFSTNEEIKTFCSLEYGVSFPIFEKVNVNGQNAHELFRYLKEELPFEGFDMSDSTNKLLDMMLKKDYPSYTIGNEIRWNFTKFLISRNGNSIKRFESSINPMDIDEIISELI